MPTFAPPTTEGNALGRDHALMKFYGAWEQGQTVWKDSLGAWHRDAYPYLGGDTHTSHDWDGSVTTGPEEGLATAQEVYLGGHVYDISDAKAAELQAAGFQVGGHWDTEEQRWVTFAVNSSANREYKGGDSSASVLLADGRSLWVFADNFVGTNTADGYYLAALPHRNALLVRAADGTLTQAFPETNPPAWTNPDGANWWWPIDIVNDGTGTSGTNFVFCWEVTTGTNFGHILRNEVLELTAFSTRAANRELDFAGGRFQIQAVYKDDTAGYHYILGLEYDLEHGGYDNYNLNTRTFTRLARCPIGSLASLTSLIEYWNGTAWSSTAPGARLVDVNGNVIDGNADLTRVGDTYVLMTQATTVDHLTLWTASSPAGPWRRFHVSEPLHKPPPGAVPTSPASYVYYLPKFHEHLNPNASQLVASYNRNIFTTDTTQGQALTATHVSTYTPQLVYLPAPE